MNIPTNPLPTDLTTTARQSTGKKKGNRERILQASIDLFNQSGVVAITTNHIAAHLKISPGNLYFHFRNKEEIIFELFNQMCEETYSVWRPENAGDFGSATPMELIERSYETFWKYRFFHREMYHLRRKDPQLAQRWKSHISKTMRLLNAMYGHWVRSGIMKKIVDPREMKMISDTVLITSSSFLQFFESPERPATRKTLRTGIEHLATFLLPYHTESSQKPLRALLGH